MTMAKLTIYRNIGSAPQRTEEIDAAAKAVWNNTETEEQRKKLKEFRAIMAEYEEKRRRLTKLPCPNCNSTWTCAKKKGTIIHCRKCGQDSEIEYID